MRGPMMDKLAGGLARSRSSPIRNCSTSRARRRRVAFADNCAPCHGAGGGGAKGYPNLNDDDWLWGGKLADIEQTIRHGVAPSDDKATQGTMPAFGRDGMLKRAEISTVADYVRSLSGLPVEPNADLAPARRSSPTIAPSAMARKARATANSARPT